MSNNQEIKKMGWALCLSLPIGLLYFFHYFHAYLHPEVLVPTGFIQIDMPFASAAAREFDDSGSFHWSYGNFTDHDPSVPKVFFQLFAFLLFVSGKLFRCDPGVIQIVFMFISIVASTRIMMNVFEHLVGLNKPAHKLTFLCFCWGGGAMVLLGIVRALWLDTGVVGSIYYFDPGRGWWFLNWCRSFVQPSEAFYHVWVCLAVWCAFIRRYKIVLVVLFIVSISHIVTGIQMLSIFLVWSLLERFVFKNKEMPLYYSVVNLLLLGLHVFYYFYFIPKNYPSYAEILEAAHRAYVMEPHHLFAAYSVLIILSVIFIFKHVGFKAFVGRTEYRLLSCIACGTLILANHHYFLEPKQPLHFTRGYIWAPLFLLSAPLISGLFDRIIGLKKKVIMYPLIFGLVGFFVLDNVVWFALHSRHNQGIYFSPDQKELVNFINDEYQADENKLLIANDFRFAYFVQVYSPIRAWCSQEHFTPKFGLRKEQVKGYMEGLYEIVDPIGRERLIVSTDIPSAYISPEIVNQTFAAHPLVFSNNTCRAWIIPGIESK